MGDDQAFLLEVKCWSIYYGYSFQLFNTNCFISILFQSTEIEFSFVLCM